MNNKMDVRPPTNNHGNVTAVATQRIVADAPLPFRTRLGFVTQQLVGSRLAIVALVGFALLVGVLAVASLVVAVA